jgi:hypothetical protein
MINESLVTLRKNTKNGKGAILDPDSKTCNVMTNCYVQSWSQLIRINLKY